MTIDAEHEMMEKDWRTRLSEVDLVDIRPLIMIALGILSSLVIETSFYLFGNGVVEHLMTIVAAVSLFEFIGRLSGWSRAYLLGWITGFVVCERFFLPWWKYIVHIALVGYYWFRERRSRIGDEYL
jgi:hypothetical protein